MTLPTVLPFLLLLLARSVDAELPYSRRYRMSSGPQPGANVEGLRSKMT